MPAKTHPIGTCDHCLGRIPGARQDEAGRWVFQRRKFRRWLADDEAHRPGPKPKG